MLTLLRAGTRSALARESEKECVQYQKPCIDFFYAYAGGEIFRHGFRLLKK
jgi:hypothetical protein